MSFVLTCCGHLLLVQITTAMYALRRSCEPAQHHCEIFGLFGEIIYFVVVSESHQSVKRINI